MGEIMHESSKGGLCRRARNSYDSGLRIGVEALLQLSQQHALAHPAPADQLHRPSVAEVRNHGLDQLRPIHAVLWIVVLPTVGVVHVPTLQTRAAGLIAVKYQRKVSEMLPSGCTMPKLISVWAASPCVPVSCSHSRPAASLRSNR